MNDVCCDIIATVPWHCGERDCPVGWHLANYWIETSGEGVEYTYDGYSDGDHETVEEGEVPTLAQIEDAWKSYWQDCAETGEDPLDQFFVSTHYTRTQKWQVEMKYGIAGVTLLGCRRNGRGEWHRTPPQELIDWMLWEKRKNGMWALDEKTCARKEYLELLRGDHDGWQPQRSHRLNPKGVASIDVDIPRSQAAVRRDVIAQAKRSLKNLEKMRTKHDK